MKNILFICSGNTCKGPLAEYLLKHKTDMLSVQSAGLIPFFAGQQASPNVCRLLEAKNIRINHTARLVTEDLVDWSDIILTMSTEQCRMLNILFPERKKQVYSLKQFVGNADHDTDIKDPFGGSFETYVNVALEIEGLVDKLLAKVIQAKELDNKLELLSSKRS